MVAHNPYDLPDEQTPLAPLVRGEAPPEATETRERRRDHLVPQLEASIATAPRLRRRQAVKAAARRTAQVFVPVAAAIGLAWLVRPAWLEPHGGASPAVTNADAARFLTVAGAAVLDRGDDRRPVLAGERDVLVAGDRLETLADGHAALRSVLGAEVDLTPATRVRMGRRQSSAERIVLLSGQVHVRVPKLERGATFGVRSPNAEVVVHGTEFVVEVDSEREGVTRTCVRVLDGLVAIEYDGGNAWLTGGQEWGCARPTALRPRPPRVNRARPPPPPATTLAEENALMRAALAAERRDDTATALHLAEQLLTRYPKSPHAPEARALRKRMPVSEAP
jgi:hypothetical protein